MPHDQLVGTTLDERYLVRARVARGGMSTVYLATDLRLNRDVAVKVLFPHLADDARYMGKLQQEARIAASLSHPHLVHMYDFRAVDGFAYLVMEYIPGHTLRDVMNARGAMGPDDALDLLDPIVEGLAAAHTKGLVHRDVKPENVLISGDGRITIGDFGLSRDASAASGTATLMGTVAYISPELANQGAADARSDIYSTGILLYELLTGHQPYRGDSAIQVAMAHVTGTVPAPSLERPGLSPEVDELVRYMTEKEPDNRPPNGAALLEDLRHIRAGLPRTRTAYPATAPAVPGPQPTEVITRAPQATTVLPAGSGLYVPGDLVAPGAEAGPDEPARSKRQARAVAKAQARAAAIPTKSLQKGHPRRRAVIWVLVVLLLALLGAGAGWFFGLGPGALATVPSVGNKTVPQARSLLERAGFTGTTVSDVFNEQVAAGLVVTSDPAADARVRKFQVITLLVSKGPVLYGVPDVVGMPRDVAQAAIAGAHLAVGVVTESYDAKVPAGVVLGQDPPADAQKRGGTTINLIVSKGPRPVPVPSVAGQSSDDAVKELTDAGLVAVIRPDRVFSRTVPEGAVAGQDPAGGTLPPGGTVQLTISKGPRMIHVPSFVGQQAADAQRQLEALGFKVQIENLLGGFFGTVRFQDPENTDAPEGSTVTLRVI